jgi:hypothetical protein
MSPRSPSLSVAATAALLSAASPSASADAQLLTAVESRTMIWNGVVAHAQAIFLSGPRWSGTEGPSVVRFKDGKFEPFPDVQWNSWVEGADPSSMLVNVNAIHDDRAGGLWIVDTGSPEFGGDPLPGGAKLVNVEIATGKISQVFTFESNIAKAGSYIDDVRIHGRIAYLTDAGQPGIIVLDLDSGSARRVLENHHSVTASDDRPIVVDGKTLTGPDKKPLKVHSDPFELSPDGHWLYYGPLEGPWSKVPTAILENSAATPEEVAGAVQPWADLPPVGGTAMASDGTLYFSDLKSDTIRKRTPDGKIADVISDARLHWVDAMYLDEEGGLWMPAAQLDRVPLFNDGVSKLKLPISVFRLGLE